MRRASEWPAPGSYLALSHVAAEARPEGVAEAVQTYNTKSSQNQAYPRTHDEVEAFFGGKALTEVGQSTVSAARHLVRTNSQGGAT